MRVGNDFLYERADGKMDKLSINHEEPNLCPICKMSIKPRILYGFCNEESRTFWAIYECRSCFDIFIKKSSFTINLQGVRSEPKEMRYSLSPNRTNAVSFSKYILSISPKFSEIYNQAYAAECYNLTEIAGIGYRKSIEFLIKDYLINSVQTDEEKDKILKFPLGVCISAYVDNASIKEVASRAVWLGNDETHYVKKHEDRDITDLKRLIDLTVRWIEMEVMTVEAIAEIQPK